MISLGKQCYFKHLAKLLIPKFVFVHATKPPPVYLINAACSFARLFKNTLDFYIGAGKEGLIRVSWKVQSHA